MYPGKSDISLGSDHKLFCIIFLAVLAILFFPMKSYAEIKRSDRYASLERPEDSGKDPFGVYWRNAEIKDYVYLAPAHLGGTLFQTVGLIVCWPPKAIAHLVIGDISQEAFMPPLETANTYFAPVGIYGLGGPFWAMEQVFYDLPMSLFTAGGSADAEQVVLEQQKSSYKSKMTQQSYNEKILTLNFIQDYILNKQQPIFNFTTNSQPMSDFYNGCNISSTPPEILMDRQKFVLQYQYQDLPLNIKIELVQYSLYAVVEYQITVTNTGNTGELTLNDFSILDFEMDFPFVQLLRSHATIDNPIVTYPKLTENNPISITASGPKEKRFRLSNVQRNLTFLFPDNLPVKSSFEYKFGILNTKVQIPDVLTLSAGESAVLPRITIMFDDNSYHCRMQNRYRRWLRQYDATYLARDKFMQPKWILPLTVDHNNKVVNTERISTLLKNHIPFDAVKMFDSAQKPVSTKLSADLTAQLTQLGINIDENNSILLYSSEATQAEVNRLFGWEIIFATAIPEKLTDPTSWRRLLAPQLLLPATEISAIQAQIARTEWEQIASAFAGDVYIVGTAAANWSGRQFNLPEERRGVLQLFRENGTFAAGEVNGTNLMRLYDLDPAAIYIFKDGNQKIRLTIPGSNLMHAYDFGTLLGANESSLQLTYEKQLSQPAKKVE